MAEPDRLKNEPITPGLKRFLELRRQEFTPEMLIDYIENNDEQYPLRDVIAEAEIMVRKMKGDLPSPQSEHRKSEP